MKQDALMTSDLQNVSPYVGMGRFDLSIHDSLVYPMRGHNDGTKGMEDFGGTIS